MKDFTTTNYLDQAASLAFVGFGSPAPLISAIFMAMKTTGSNWDDSPRIIIAPRIPRNPTGPGEFLDKKMDHVSVRMDL